MPRKKVTKVKRAKAGKAKKEGKQETKAVKESDIEKAKANAALWELRLQVTDRSLVEYREACRKLARANEELTCQLYRAEKDSIDVTGFLKRQDASKEDKINTLQKSLKRQDVLAREEQNKVVNDYKIQITEMKELFKKKSSDFNMIQDGMKNIKEFQKRKTQMEQELSDIRENMDAADKEHGEDLNKMEYKFFKEKDRLEKEAERTIAQVVERAHTEAIVQLDDASRSVFKENVRLNEALKYHMKEAEQLQILTISMANEKASLTVDKNTFELMVKKNAAQMEAQKKELSNLRAKVASLEQALELKALEPEREEKEEKKTLISIQAGQVELEKLQKVLSMRERELGHVKRLAGTVVQQRTELEQFFHEALAQVKQEIMASRSQYKKEALQAYRWRLREATAGKLKFPPIRTFQKGPHSTNSVYSDMEAAARWTHPPGSKVEISDLTWEQKEQVLRLLFAKMNGQTERKPIQPLALSASSEKKSLIDSDAAGIREELSPATFITQAPEPVLPSNPNSLPDIHTA
ncbi:basal body-orientation factor 1-like [Anoplopoma fimbria]|uniref:basal body-orientation factor 1-like n=1 Tax=Anoplopoma fimbria TaxID=229290 RepID=UPI0023EBD4DE|nr:basal body-orientation factor 1-like [Anoplopoma fimbria]